MAGDGKNDETRPPRVGRLTRRAFLKAGAAAGVAGAVGSGLSASQGRLIQAALAGSSGGSLSDIEHVVILMQENRSFDHYFGTMPGVRGFSDLLAKPGVFAQTMVDPSTGKALYKLASGETTLNPFELVSNPPTVAGQTTNDITHDWGPQHQAWNDGAMDQWAVQHLKNDGTSKYQFNVTDGVPVPGSSSVPIGLLTMGYYRQSDCLAFYRALADAFTICDAYHCSVLGPTDPNRLMWMSGSLGAHSADNGGPVLTTYVSNRQDLVGTLDWPTLPELLTDSGVSWKVYQDPTSTALFNVLPYFKSFAKPSTATEARNAANALVPVYPAEFQADVLAGTLPKVSWIMPPAPCCEHPATPPEYGEWLVSEILQTLLLNPEVWERTVFLVVYDENGGFFDHVAPPTPGPTVTSLGSVPTGSEYDGEYLHTASPTNAAGGPPSDWDGVLGPVGLGFRVPAMVISPFSAGGWVNSDTMDHISTHKLIERLFLTPGTIQGGLHVSPWRYATVGDFTGAMANLTTPKTRVGKLPDTSLLFPGVAEQALLNSLAGTEGYAQAYPPPPRNAGVPGPDPVTISRRPTPR
ncbi:MAG TPA: alkaline phosphatase family protein [Acidimicrobiales bacterium]|nr:alkaline phosphatase family protein [Acidimicrobiales bacterium]